MAKFCQSCGKSLEDNAQFCDGCGATVGAAAPNPVVAAPGVAADATQEVFDPADIEKNKAMAGLAYIIFFLPLIACPDSKFARFHANQALILLIASIIGYILSSILVVILIGFLLYFVVVVMQVVLTIMGLINGFNGQAKKLPILGKLKFTIIK